MTSKLLAIFRPRSRLRCLLLAGLALVGMGGAAIRAQTGTPAFDRQVSVHDPSVIRVGDRFYVFGSHMASASTDDLMNWTQLTGDGATTLIPNAATQLAEAVAFANGRFNMWAPDVIQLPDGQFCYYYCVTEATAPTASIGILKADEVEGPYLHDQIILQGGPGHTEEGSFHDARIHPHVIDPTVFWDAEGILQMVYGSYSGGIFILELDHADGTVKPGQGYGTHLWGGQHARIEGPYIIYNPESEYYYLFVSYYGLAAGDGYNIRVARSRNVAGPYLDSAGTDMSTVSGAPGTVFDDVSIAPHGVELMGAYRFFSVEGEPQSVVEGFLSPGHNSAYYDPEAEKYYLIFHTRFVGRGEFHEVRVHQMYFNSEDWPVVAPYRYAGETRRHYREETLVGPWKVINHGPKAFFPIPKNSVTVDFAAGGGVSGSHSGIWELSNGERLRLVLDGIAYEGIVTHQWDTSNSVWVLTFSALSNDGVALWGSQVAVDRTSLETFRWIHFGSTANTGVGADEEDPNGNGLPNLVEYALHADPMAPGSEALQTSLVDGSFEFTFERIMDASLHYRIEASDQLHSPTSIWSSTGVENTLGPVSVRDGVDLSTAERRFLQLRVQR